MQTYKEKYYNLHADVAKMLVDFRKETNEDHGRYLLNKWDHIRSKYDAPS